MILKNANTNILQDAVYKSPEKRNGDQAFGNVFSTILLQKEGCTQMLHIM